MKWLLRICASSITLYAQTLEVSSTVASPGEPALVLISIHAAKGRDVLGVQWETTFSGSQMSIENGGAQASDGAKAAGKSLTCAGKSAKESDLYSYTCILIGGQKPVESGPVAVLNFLVSPKAQSGATPVRVGHAEAVGKDLRKLSLPDAKGIVTVKQ